jgi:hypothetical protein
VSAHQVATAPRVPEPGVPVEARSAPRVPATAVPTITGVRLSPYGADARLLNISASGVLVECTGRIRLGTTVTTIFDGTFSPSSVEGRVARSSVATVSAKGVLLYHVGIAFVIPIAFELAPAEVIAAPEPPPQPILATQATPTTPPTTTTPATSPAPPVLTNRW